MFSSVVEANNVDGEGKSFNVTFSSSLDLYLFSTGQCGVFAFFSPIITLYIVSRSILLCYFTRIPLLLNMVTSGPEKIN